MKRRFTVFSLMLLLCVASIAAFAADSGVLSAQEVKKVVPDVYFFRGQSAPVQIRNSSGFKVGDKFVLAGLVDTSGYAADVQSKYRGFFITEVKLTIEGKDLAPGAYGFGFSKEGKFTVLDVGANDLLSVDAHSDENLKRPVPLKIEADGDGYRLYANRQYVSVKAQ